MTKADLKSDSIITKVIRDAFPSHNILTEESGFSNKNSRYTWVIDPLDGTSNFAAAIPWFGVLICLFEGNEPILGGAYLPVQDDLYIAMKDKGAYKNGKQVRMDLHNTLKNSLFSFCVDFTDNEAELDKSVAIYKNLVKACRGIPDRPIVWLIFCLLLRKIRRMCESFHKDMGYICAGFDHIRSRRDYAVCQWK